jgi:hypothetical protein
VERDLQQKADHAKNHEEDQLQRNAIQSAME